MVISAVICRIVSPSPAERQNWLTRSQQPGFQPQPSALAECARIAVRRQTQAYEAERQGGVDRGLRAPFARSVRATDFRTRGPRPGSAIPSIVTRVIATIGTAAMVVRGISGPTATPRHRVQAGAGRCVAAAGRASLLYNGEPEAE